MNQSEDFGKILKLWPNLVDHYRWILMALEYFSAHIIAVNGFVSQCLIVKNTV